MLNNYHAHTYRCGHAIGTEEDFVFRAIEAGCPLLGFSDHSPFPGLYSPHMRMTTDQLPGYIRTIQELIKQHQGRIELHIGLECEYFPDYINWLKETKEQYRLEYLIFGNHYHLFENGQLYYGSCKTREDIKKYIATSLAGMETGLFLYFAHPDLFMKGYPVFDDVCADASRQIAKCAAALNLPLEYNLLGQHGKSIKGYHRGVGYPSDAFWEIAAKENIKAVIGLDAHAPEHFDCEELLSSAREFLAGLDIPVIEKLKLD